jgi:hypothetical protein
MATVAKRYILPLGPVKIEVINITAITDADTVTSSIQRPDFGLFVQGEDAGNTQLATNVSISGRTVTLNNGNFSSSTGVLLLFGF